MENVAGIKLHTNAFLPHQAASKYRIIHTSLRDYRPLRYSSQDGHAEGEHVNRGRDTQTFCPTVQVLEMSFLLCLSWFLRSRVCKLRRDLWITLMYPTFVSRTGERAEWHDQEFSKHNTIIFEDGGKVVSLTHRPPLHPGNAPGTHFCQRLSRPQGHSAIGGIMSKEKFQWHQLESKQRPSDL